MQFALRFDPNPLIHCLHHPAVRVLILKSIIWLPYIFVVGKWNLKAKAIQKHLAAKENQNQVKITQLPNLQAKKHCQQAASSLVLKNPPKTLTWRRQNWKGLPCP